MMIASGAAMEECPSFVDETKCWKGLLAGYCIGTGNEVGHVSNYVQSDVQYA
jgi:hypothetical protein